MKKKIVSLMLIAAMTMSMVVGCSTGKEESKAEETTKTEETAKEESTGDYQFVSPADAVKAAKDGKTHVLDVREWDNYVSGRVADSKWCPIFPLEEESLAEAMKTYATDNLKDGNEIYIICNSGQRGAQKATEVFTEAGIDASLIYTVEGGAKALADENGALTTKRADENIEWKYISAEEALESVGKEDVQILDVRDDDTYAQGHLEGSLQCGLKEIEDAKAQTEMYKLATEKMDKEKPVYLLCYSGNKCAKTAISIMKDAGFDTENLFIIENGAKDEGIQAAFVTE